MKHLLRKTYVTMLPQSIRSALRNVTMFDKFRARYFHADTSLHDTYYDEDYYRRDATGPAAKAAAHVLADIQSRFSARSVIDVGCGTGEYLEAARALGMQAWGVDLSQAAIKVCRQKKLDVVQADLSQPGNLPWRADVVYSFEVAEHLAESAASHFARKLCHAAMKSVILTAARPGQAGVCHINCQPKSYWIAMFESHSFQHNAVLTQELENRYRQLDLAPWLHRNLMVFEKI